MPGRIAVVGAGISGLACAEELARAGFAVTVYEREQGVGGRMASRTKDGFPFDIGADHLCDLYDGLKAACAAYGIPWQRVDFLKYGIVRKGAVLSPGQAVGRLSALRLAAQYLLMKKVGDFLWLDDLAVHDDANAYDYMRVRAGKDVSEYYVDSFSTTYQFHRARDISLGALLGIMRSIQKDKARWHLHRTPGGMSALPEAMASRLDVRRGTPVTGVTAGEGVVVETAAGSETYDAAVLAAPAPVTLTLYKNPTEAQRRLLAETRFASTIAVSFRVRRELLPDTAVVWVPFVESEKICGYVNEAMKGEGLVRGGETLLNVWLHEDYATGIMGKSDAEVFARVKEAFLPVCPWISSADQLKDHDLQRWQHAMPKFAHGHLRAVKEFMEREQGAQDVYFAGDWLNSPWTEGAYRCGKRVAAQVSARLSAAPR